MTVVAAGFDLKRDATWLGTAVNLYNLFCCTEQIVALQGKLQNRKSTKHSKLLDRQINSPSVSGSGLNLDSVMDVAIKC